MADGDDLARRAVGVVTALARRGTFLAVRVAFAVAIVALMAYGLGLAGLKGSTRSAWAIVGGILVVITVGAPLLAAWRLRRVRTHADQLVADVRTLMTNNAEAERIVIETVEVDQRGPATTPAIVGQAPQFARLRQVAVTTGNLPELPGTLQAVGSFPALLALAVLLTLVFLVLGFVFLLALVF